ncbi:hypothetical protein SRABI27_03775 [Pedobacter sp. Bi27]|uniref:HTH domain-containing protein n=1 Tax=Pedobacter sp. Bi27 TaxID=2822351 RepID=UPI001D23B85D|nr:HTH domain-containing protein [Pedobacter sp. Bi27]CAH0281059.1 hypothetical protein SRABI27_03775 [Pedobacter sp. Bi27]
MPELKWKEAIVKVFEEEKKALHYIKIAEIIAEKKYRTSLGATPSDTVSSNITTDINTNKHNSIFARVDKGIYILRKFLNDEAQISSNDAAAQFLPTSEPLPKDKLRVINAFGIYWSRQLVHWGSKPDLLGIQQLGATEVNFKDQRGIYLLYDGREVIYAGQAIEQTLGDRLRQHLSDRLSGRWDRFSWFGFYAVDDKGHLKDRKKFPDMDIQDMANILEAILIESLEPRQNRKQGNNTLVGMEFLQKESPEIKKRRYDEVIKELAAKID